MKLKRIFAVLATLVLAVSLNAQDLKFFKLGNGMSVYVWEDHSVHDVFGAVAVKAGAFDDPSEYTGLAHYLEHVLFKGTSKIGALDWEKEKPIYESIVAKYDELALETDPAKRAALTKEINELSIAQSKLTVANEYTNLLEGIGGEGVNAATSYDVTFYHNSFPSSEIVKWLQVASERFINPVFRGFQSELETVYEEYNMYRDRPGSQANQFLMSKAFEGTPYERDVIGLGEHLKNPRLSKLIQFYKDWYVANNMALVLVGDVDTKSIMRFINLTFGKIAPGTTPEKPSYPATQFSGRKSYTTRCSQYPSVTLVYDAVLPTDPDRWALELCSELLTSSTGTGLLDRKVIAGDLLGAQAAYEGLNAAGRLVVTAIPFYDDAQNMFDSSKKVEKILNESIGELKSGKVEPGLVEAVKTAMCRDFDLSMEDNQSKAMLLVNAFAGNLNLADELAYKDKIKGVTIEDIARVSKKYFNSNVMVFNAEQGDQAKSDKIKKPEIKPVEPAKGQTSQYAQWFRSLTSPAIKEDYMDWTKVKERGINSYSKLYYTENTKNDVFTLVLKYGANAVDFPKLEYAADLMDNAGIMAAFKPSALKEEFARLGATYSISADRNYLYVTLRGYEVYLREACQLLTRMLLLPDLDSKQLDNLRGGAISSRFVRKKNVNTLATALREYIIYGDESTYRKELSDKELLELNISKLTGNVIDATKYAAEIHYSGRMPFEDVYGILSTSLPLVEGEKPTTSPLIRPMKQYSENTVYFLPNSDAQQSQIYFYIPMGKYDKKFEVVTEALNSYLGGGFNGLILQEIREYNSMAYTAAGNISSPGLPDSPRCFLGYVGTQNDKAVDAIKLFTKLLKEMPEHPENLNNIKEFLKRNAFSSQPDERSLSSAVVSLRRKGYTEDPAKEELPQIDALTFEDLVSFYKENIQNKPIVIGIVGNPKNISNDGLSQFGKVVRLSNSKLFNETDVMFQR